MAARRKRTGKAQKAKQADQERAVDKPSVKTTDKRVASKATGAAEAEAATADESAEPERLKLELAALEARHAETLDRLTRAHADFANYRRRAEEERREIMAFANQALALELLRVLDAFERAFQSLPAELRQLTWVDGIALVSAQLRGTLDACGVTPIECKPNDPIDVNLHSIATSEEGDGPMVVLQELQRGYRMHDRVLRPALVKVGPRRESEPAAAPDAPQPDGDGGDTAASDAAEQS